MSKRTIAWASEWTSEWINSWQTERMDEQASERANKRVNEQMNESTNERMHACLFTYGIHWTRTSWWWLNHNQLTSLSSRQRIRTSNSGGHGAVEALCWIGKKKHFFKDLNTDGGADSHAQAVALTTEILVYKPLHGNQRFFKFGIL